MHKKNWHKVMVAVFLDLLWHHSNACNARQTTKKTRKQISDCEKQTDEDVQNQIFM